MSVLIYVSVYDHRAKYYQDPVKVCSKEVAIRQFELSCRDKTSVFYQCPADFSLYFVGVFNANSGAFFSKEEPEWLCDATNFIPAIKDDEDD